MGKQRPTRRKLAQFFNWKIKATLIDDKIVEGIIMGVDKHFNVVLKDAEEKRLFKVKNSPDKEMKRMLGLTVIRGDEIQHIIPIQNSGLDLCDTPAVMEKKNVAQARARSNKEPPPGVTTAPKPGEAGAGGPPGANPMMPGAGRGGMRPGMPGGMM